MGLFLGKIATIPEEYVAFNSFPPEKERLLCVGGATAECKHYIDAKVANSNKALKLYYPKKRAAAVIKYWLPMFDITDSHSAQQVITRWIDANDYTQVVSSTISKKVQKEITKANKSVTDISHLLATAQENHTVGAFDLERLGYLVRVCFSLDFLSEQQAWHFLEQLYQAARTHFPDWDTYMVSFVTGQEGLNTNWYSETMKSYLQLKNDSDSLYNRYPLH